LLSGLGSPWNTLQLAGNLGFHTQKLAGVWSLTGGLQSMTGAAQIEALQLQTALSTVRPLGSYRGVLNNSQLILQTANPEDALQLTGQGVLVGKVRFQGEAVASAGKEAALSNLLHIIGQRQTSTDGRLRTVLTLEK
jgi:general secretion pathway protein N